MRLTHLSMIAMIVCALIISCDQQQSGGSDATSDAGKAETKQVSSATTKPATTAPSAGNTSFKSVEQKASYGMGNELGTQLYQMKQMGMEIDIDAFVAGLRDAHAGNKPQLTPQEIQGAMMEMQKRMMAKHGGAAGAPGANSELAQKNLEEAKKFLAENAKKEGVKTTKSGLQYQVIKSGDGETPSKEDTFIAHYTGTLIDGTEFDSSVKRGKPLELPVGHVIPGWTEALQLMKVGDKWRLFIPPDLGYGVRGAGRDIGPNALLIFEMELLGVKHPAGHDHDHDHAGHAH